MEHDRHFCLTVLNGDQKGKSFLIGQGVVTIGRHNGCTICFEKDEFVSIVHCCLYLQNSQVFLKDIHSANGTFVNGHKIPQMFLQIEDIVQVGKAKLQLKTSEVFFKRHEKTQRNTTKKFMRASGKMLEAVSDQSDSNGSSKEDSESSASSER